MKKILSAIVIVMVLGADLSRAQLNIYKGKLTTSLNANGNSISNVVSITDTNGNPVIGGTGTGISTNGGSGIGNIFTNTILNNASTPTAFTFTNGSGIPAQVEAYTGPLSGLSAFTTNSSGGWIDLFDIVGSGANQGVVLNSGSFQGNGSGLTGVTNSQAGSFNTIGSNTVSTLSTAAAGNVVNGILNTNPPAWNGSNYVFIATGGNTSNNGLTKQTPVNNPILAEQIATNLMANGGTNITIDLMPGVFNNAGNFVHLPDNVNWYSEPGAILVWTNPVINSIQNAGFTPGNNSQIYSLNMFNPDQGTTVCAIGEGTTDSNAGNASKTNWIFWNLYLLTYGSGLHWERGGAATTPTVGTFINPVVIANRSCVVDKTPNLHIVIQNRNFTVSYFTNNTVGDWKPLSIFDLENRANNSNGPAFYCVGGSDTYSDAGDGTNMVYDIFCGNLYGVQPLAGTNVVISMSDSLLNPLSETNPLSFDFSFSTNGCAIIQNTVQLFGGTYPTVTNTFSGGDGRVFSMTSYPTNAPTANAIHVTSGTTTYWTQSPTVNSIGGNTNTIPYVYTNFSAFNGGFSQVVTNGIPTSFASQMAFTLELGITNVQPTAAADIVGIQFPTPYLHPPFIIMQNVNSTLGGLGAVAAPVTGIHADYSSITTTNFSIATASTAPTPNTTDYFNVFIIGN